MLDRISRLIGRLRRELTRTDRITGPAFWGTRESLALGLALAVFAALGAGLWALGGVAARGGPDSMLTADGQASAPPARLVPVGPGRFVFPGGSPALTWPSTGLAAVEVAGFGLMGQSGSLQRRVPIASITKTMTAYVVLMDHPLGAHDSGPTLTLTSAEAAQYGKAIAQDESAVPVRPGERLTERQALEAMMLASAGDMADILAIWDAGSIDGFLAKMNRQARALGMTATDYTDPTGLAASTVSTMADQLKLAEAVQHLPALTSIVSERDAWVPVAGQVHNYNEDLGQESIDGIKTGTTAAAGSCLLFSAHTTVDGRAVTILGIVLGLPGSTGTPWAALFASRALVTTARQALGTATAVSAGAPVARIEQAGRAAEPLAPVAPVRVFGWAGLVYRVTVTGGVGSAGVRVTRTSGTPESVGAALGPLRHRVAAAGYTVRTPESTPAAAR